MIVTSDQPNGQGYRDPNPSKTKTPKPQTQNPHNEVVMLLLKPWGSRESQEVTSSLILHTLALRYARDPIKLRLSSEAGIIVTR